jgi:transcriptional regulator with XRE-family HTH domain
VTMETRDSISPLSEALRILRVFHDLSQSEAATRLEISAPYLSQLESGKKTASLDILRKYSAAFAIPSSSILLLAERILNVNSTYEDAGSLISPKVLRILDWLHEKAKSTPKKTPAREYSRTHLRKKRA